VSGVGHARFGVHDVVASVNVSVLGGRKVRLLGWRRQVDHRACVKRPCGQTANQHIPTLLSLYFAPLDWNMVSLLLCDKPIVYNSHFPNSGRSILVIWP
jgi:hypothetical protein